MIPEKALKAEDVRGMMLDRMEKHLSLKTEGYRSTTHETFNLLLKAVAEGSSLEAVCADRSGAVASNTLREQLNVALAAGELRQQEAKMNAALQAAIPAGMPRGGLEIALDTHDEPFYGKTPHLRAYTCRSRAKDGTTRFFRIASVYVIWREVRLTLALTYVLPEDDLRGVVVQDVTIGGPAYLSGLRPADVIMAIDGQPMTGMSTLVAYLASNTTPGQSVNLTVWRDGQMFSANVTLGERP